VAAVSLTQWCLDRFGVMTLEKQMMMTWRSRCSVSMDTAALR